VDIGGKQQVNSAFGICVRDLNQAHHLQRPDAPPRPDVRPPPQDFERSLHLSREIRIATLRFNFDGRHSLEQGQLGTPTYSIKQQKCYE